MLLYNITDECTLHFLVTALLLVAHQPLFMDGGAVQQVGGVGDGRRHCTVDV